MCNQTVLLTAAILGSCLPAKAQTSNVEKPRDMLAAQIRMQGYVCDKPLAATKDAKLSKPDRAVWILRCSNANYSVNRVPDMAAKVTPLK
ncbi:MAG: hypothetical protein G4V63_22605 [Candidatus Afipia apatlaquensis]|uniref:Secreted protein n=1 Tax=Candidatus Afipia apatlaquensis TaxID=2712852 RepID=A0A7C9RLU6_9BRAD|nr:hypothetical protein [Candidatus Afipia apatlaquensis]